MPEWPKGTGCKPVGICLRRFKSSPAHDADPPHRRIPPRSLNRVDVARGRNPVNASIHQQLANFIWKICNLLRGPYKRNEYRKVILPLTVLRRFDCVLADTKQAVLAAHEQHADQPDAVREPLLAAASGLPFYNTSKLDFHRLLDDPNLLAQNLNAYIGGFSENVREVIERFGLADHVARMDEKNLLYEVVKEFAGVDLSVERVDNMQMGYAFEELIRIGAEQSNEEAGEHFTPREVIRLMVGLLLSPEPDLGKSHVVKTIYDPACGTGGMLSVAEEHLLEHNAESRPMLFGQDYNDEAWAVCKSDMLLKGQDADRIIRGDTFTSDGFDRRRDGSRWTFDYMLANTPFGVEWKQQELHVKNEYDTIGYDGRFGAGTPRINDGSLLFLQHMLSKRQPVAQGGGGAASPSCSTARPCSPATRGAARATSAAGSSRATGWKPSWRCPTRCSTTPASPPTSGCSPTARSRTAPARCSSSTPGRCSRRCAGASATSAINYRKPKLTT